MAIDIKKTIRRKIGFNETFMNSNVLDIGLFERIAGAL